MNHRPLRLCIVSAGYPPYEEGGIGTYTRALAEGLVALGYQPTVISFSEQQSEVVEVDGVELHRVHKPALPKVERFVPELAWSSMVAYKVMELSLKKGFDVVEFPNWEGPGLVYTHLPKRLPVVTRVHTPYFETLELDKGDKIELGDRYLCWQEKRAVRAADAVISSTRAHRAMMAGAYGLSEAQVHILPLGITLPPTPPAQWPAKGRDEPLSVLYVSRLESRKGTQTLIDAIPRVVARFPKVHFTFVGRDRPHAPGERLFSDYFKAEYGQFMDKVTFAGFVDDEELVGMYQGCDIFAVPSIYESFGLIFLEAMGHGKPVIGCQAGGMPEVIADQETGFLTEPKNVDELTERLVQLLEDRQLRESMGRAGRQRVETLFDKKVMAQNAVDFYSEVARR